MFIRKTKHDAIVAEKDAEIDLLAQSVAYWHRQFNTEATSRAEVESSRDIALRRAAHLEAEVAQLMRDIAGLLPDAERYRAQKAKRSMNLVPGGKPRKARDLRLVEAA